ncbi:MAG: peptidoglycan glycosyltransferase, partial [Clostridiales bacterium]|nr:peptidoglycan glycosyltransferase [Clostridiales bacterium]
SGEILGMVSMPDFDLNTPREIPYGISEKEWSDMTSEEQAEYLMRNAWRNRCISDTYEPGSTMKAVTTAIALEEGLTYEDEIFSDAPIEITTVDTIRCWREKTDGNHGDETLREAFERSCNPIFVRLAQRIGIEKYYDYIHNCGFYDVTGVDLPAEGKGIFHAEPTEVDLATLSFGESSTVTPLQLISVYSALVNGGDLMRPHIASRVVDANGNIIREYEPEKVRTIFSSRTSARVRNLLEDVVKEGTGSAGYVPGYYVAGKTSTSTIDVGEEAGMHVISFGCYAPSYDPKIAVLVVINKPEDKDVGSSAAAKVSARIVEETLEYMNVDRKLSKEEYDRMGLLFHVPDVTGKTFLQAKKELEDEGFTVLDGTGSMSLDSIVGTMYYGQEETVYKNSVIVLYPDTVAEEDMNKTPIPNFTGMNII